MPDAHFGVEDERAIWCAAKVVEYIKPARVVHLGDLLECGPFASWVSHKMSLAKQYDFVKHEIDPARRWIDFLMKHCRLYVQHEGNHEWRVERQAIGSGDFGRAVWDLIRPDRAILGGYDRSRVRWIPYLNTGDVIERYHLAPDLITIHGWTCAENAASVILRKASKYGWSVIYGHTHRDERKTTRGAGDRVLIAESAGCLRTLNPTFTQARGPTDWSQGLTLGYQSEHNRRDWTLYSVNIYKGRAILPDGTEISA